MLTAYLYFRPIDAIVQTIRQCDIEKFGVEDLKSLMKFIPDKTIVSRTLNQNDRDRFAEARNPQLLPGSNFRVKSNLL